MTSRPGPGIQESLQHRGGGPAYAPVRRATNPQHGQQESIVEADRGPAEERGAKAKPKGKPIPLDGIQTTATDSVKPTPKGKPQLFYTNVGAGRTDPSVVGQAVSGLPVPPRPGSALPGDASQQRGIVPGGTGVKAEAVARTQGPEATMPAVMFAGGKTADLFPWTGNHPEDVLSEALVKGGINNKSQIMNETNTARPSLWSNLKNKSGISTLSTLFVAVLEKRQTCSRLTAPNTFKPPPRLTLRDSTRETWLHDLANPAVGLRRLSRTIPTGITGKVLLEQCLNKNIPIPRAMWLAKCVGINEIRSHKRKGQVGTMTWIRSWTSSVEQFLDGTVAAIGQHEWKPRITYALQLTTHLFKEHLLEEDHFLDWALKNLDSSSPERLFLWLLIVCIPDFWLSFTSSRRRGRRLAESLLGHAEKLYGLEDEAQNTPVLAFLENIVFKLLITKPACLVLPKSWERYRKVLHIFAQRRPHTEITQAVSDLDKRNQQIIRPSHIGRARSHDSVGRVYSLLDALDYGVNIPVDELAFDCMDIISDANSLISTALQWTSSVYRQGSHRIYVTTRLLRKWSHLGADVHDGILNCLPHMASDPSKDEGMIFRVIAELVRSKTFSLGRYLQWLIATGSLSQHRNLHSASAWPLRLLTEIPLASLSEHVRNLRYTLLRGTDYSTDDEDEAIIAAEEAIRPQIPSLFDEQKAGSDYSNLSTEGLNATVRFEIGIWLRQQVAANLEVIEHAPTKDPSVDEESSVCRITLSDFHVIRDYLEQCNDYSILADIVGIVATSFDSSVLSAVADTLHYNYKAFRAIGAFDPLFEKIAMRYAAIRTVRFPERDLLLGLTALSAVTRADPQLTQLLNYDLSRYDQKNSLAACSPVSDNMIESTGAVDTEDEIERILSSGTSMDQQMMSRVFGKITMILEEQLCKGLYHNENFSSWFCRLRNFEEYTFDLILTSWLGSLLMSHQTQLLSAALPRLVAAGCLTLPRFLKTVQDCVRSRQSSQPVESLRIAVEGFNKILPSVVLSGGCPEQDAYRYRIEQFKFCQQRDGGILEFIHDFVEMSPTASTGEIDKQFSDTLADERLLNVLRHFAISDMQSLSALTVISQKTSSEVFHLQIQSLLHRLLDPINQLRLSEMDTEHQVATIVETADLLSLPFCQLGLQQIFAMSASTGDNTDENVSGALIIAIKRAVEQNQPYWSDLISGLEPSFTNKIREHAEREIINASTFLCSGEEAGEQGNDQRPFIHKYLSVIDVTTTCSPLEVPASLLVSLVERLKGIAELLSKGKEASKGYAHVEGSLLSSELGSWLNALLRLVVVHGPALMVKASNQHQAALMWTLRTLVAHPTLESSPTITQYMFDVALLLSGSISDDVRKHLARLDVAKATDDTRCAFIFGAVPPPDGWLNLTKPINDSQNSQAASSPQTQSQPSNSTQSQYRGQQQSASPAPLQRSLSQQHLQQSQGQGRGYQYSQQPNKVLPQQLQRMASNGHGGQATQLQQLQQMQQMQAMAQQRNGQPSPNQQQRASATLSQSAVAGKGSAAKQEKVELKSIPFSLSRWEILPESGGNPAGNETAISLSLFGARKV